MGLNLGSLIQRLFDLSPMETSFERRGFRGGGPATRARLEKVGAAFVEGYRAALDCDAKSDPSQFGLSARLETVACDFRGFAYEGAAMGLALLDVFTPWRRHRVRGFLA